MRQFLFLGDRDMRIEDQKIIDSFYDDDEQGLQALFDRYYRPLCVYGFKFLNDLYLAEDIVQDVFVRFWEHKKYTDIKGSLKSYLFISVRNRSLNHLSNNKTIKTEYIEHLKEEFLFEEFDEDELEEKKETLYAEIAQLPPQSQRVLKMIVFEQKKYKEVSDELGISLNTVKTHFSRALRQLRGSFMVLVALMLS